MKVEVSKTFEKDAYHLRDKKLALKLSAIIKNLEESRSILDIKNLKSIKGHHGYYRIRIGDYRLGLKSEKDSILLLRFMHRKEIYKYFP